MLSISWFIYLIDKEATLGGFFYTIFKSLKREFFMLSKLFVSKFLEMILVFENNLACLIYYIGQAFLCNKLNICRFRKDFLKMLDIKHLY